MKDIENGYVKIEKTNRIATVEFYHPAANSMPSVILLELASAIDRLSADEEVKVVILQSGGDKTFCSGAAFNELLAIESPLDGRTFFTRFAQVINAMRKSHQLIIAKVQGKAVGGGVGLAAAADYAIASDTASIKLSELSIGIGPFVVGPAIIRKIGLTAFSQLAINATQWQSAEWAYQKGLFTELYGEKKKLEEAISSLAEELSKSNPEAIWELKKMLWAGTENWDSLLPQNAEISGRLVTSSFTRNALNAFRK